MKKLVFVVFLLAFVSLVSAETIVDCFVQGITCPAQCRSSAERVYNTIVGANPCALTGSGYNYCYIEAPVACGTSPYTYSEDGKCATLAEAGAGWTNFTGTPEFACGLTGTTPKYCYSVPCSAQGSGDGICSTGPTGEYVNKVGEYTCGYDWENAETKYCYEEPDFQDCSVYNDCETSGSNTAGCLCINDYDPSSGYHGGWGNQCDYSVGQTMPCRSGEAESMCVDPNLWGQSGSTSPNTCTWSMIIDTTPSPLVGAGTVEVTVKYFHFDTSIYSSNPVLFIKCDAGDNWDSQGSINKNDGEVTFDCDYGAVTSSTTHVIAYEFRQEVRSGFTIEEWNNGVTVTQAPGDDFYAACTTYNACDNEDQEFCSCVEQDFDFPTGCSLVTNVNCRQGVATKCVLSTRDSSNNNAWSCPSLEVNLEQTEVNEVTVQFSYDGTDVSSGSSSPIYWYKCDTMGTPYQISDAGLNKGSDTETFTCTYPPISQDEEREITVSVVQNLNIGGPDLIARVTKEIIQDSQWSGGSGGGSGGSGYGGACSQHAGCESGTPCLCVPDDYVIPSTCTLKDSSNCRSGEATDCVKPNSNNYDCSTLDLSGQQTTSQNIAIDASYGGLDYSSGSSAPFIHLDCDGSGYTEVTWLNKDGGELTLGCAYGAVQSPTNRLIKVKIEQELNGGKPTLVVTEQVTVVQQPASGGGSGGSASIPSPSPTLPVTSALVEGIRVTSPADSNSYASTNGMLDLNFIVHDFWNGNPSGSSVLLTCDYYVHPVSAAPINPQKTSFTVEFAYPSPSSFSRQNEIKGLTNGWHGITLECRREPTGFIERAIAAIPFIGQALVSVPTSRDTREFYYSRQAVGSTCTDSDGDNIFLKGYCVETSMSASELVSGVVKRVDYCDPSISIESTSNLLHEYLCVSPMTPDELSASIYKVCDDYIVACEYGCVDGACLTEPAQSQTWCEEFPAYAQPSPSPQATLEPEAQEYAPVEIEGRTEDAVEFGGHNYLIYQQSANKAWVRDTDSGLSVELDEGAVYDAFLYADHEVRLQLVAQVVDNNNLVSTIKFVYYTEAGAAVKPPTGSSSADTVTICLSVIAPLDGSVYYNEKVSLSYLIHPLDASGVPFVPPQGYEDWTCYYELNSVPFMPPIYQSHDVTVKYGESHSEVMDAGFGDKMVQVMCDPTNPQQELSYGLESDEVEFTVREAGFSVSLDEPQNETYYSDSVPWEFTINCPPAAQEIVGDAYFCQGELDGEFYELIRDNQVNYFYCGVPVSGAFDLAGNYGQHYANVQCAAESDPANFVKSNTVWFSNYPANVPVVLEPENKTYWSDAVDLSFVVDGTYDYYACAYGFDGNEMAFPQKDPNCLPSRITDCAKSPKAEFYFQAGEIYFFDGLLQVEPGQHEVFVSCAGLSPNEDVVPSKWLDSKRVYFTSLDEGMPILYEPQDGDVYYYYETTPGATVTGVFEVGGFQGGATDPVLFECYYSLNGVKHNIGVVEGAVDPEFDMTLTAGAYALNVTCDKVDAAEAPMTSNTAHFTVVEQQGSPTPTPTATPTATPGPGGSGGGSGGSGGGVYGPGSQGPGNATATPSIPALPTWQATATPQGSVGESYLNVNCPQTITEGWNQMDAYLSFKGDSKCDQSLAVTVTLDGETVAGAGRLDSCSSGSHSLSFNVGAFGDYAVSIVSPAYGLSGNCVFKDGGLVAEEVPDLTLFAALLAALVAGYALSKRK